MLHPPGVSGHRSSGRSHPGDSRNRQARPGVFYPDGMAGSSAAVAATKVTAPRPPSRYLRRARLIERLDESIAAGRGVVLVSAPAGAGKSTLVNGWLDGRSGRVGWLQIDEGDDDPSRFWAYVAAALRDAVPSLGAAIGAAVGDGVDAVVDAVVNEIGHAGHEVVLVIDDYHLVSNPDVHRSVERLIALRPPNLVVVVSTRIDPPFRLGRLRVRDQLTEIRAADLRFDLHEAGFLLDADAVGLDAEAVERLVERTEGWAAGLVLASLSMRDGGDTGEFVSTFHGDDHLVADYLSEEFLESIGSEERRRLLDVSVLERMSGPLIDEVCGTSDGATWLDALAASNQLVITLDRTGTWFRFHHLLRDLLRNELERSAPERFAELNAAAGRWHVASGDLMAAVEHLLQAGSPGRSGRRRRRQRDQAPERRPRLHRHPLHRTARRPRRRTRGAGDRERLGVVRDRSLRRGRTLARDRSPSRRRRGRRRSHPVAVGDDPSRRG